MAHSPFSMDCPADILIECFLSGIYPDLPDMHPSSVPIIVTRVCRRWRHVALSTPLLWSRLSVRITSKKDKTLQSGALECFERCLSRSLDAPLTCSIRDETRAGCASFDQYLDVLLRHARRWKTISLSTPSHRSSVPPDTQFPLLKTLKINWIYDCECMLTPLFENAPKLTSLTLRSSHAFDCFAIAPQLTSLSLAHFSQAERYAVRLPLQPAILLARPPDYYPDLFVALPTFTSLTSLHIEAFVNFQRDFTNGDKPTEEVVLPNIHTFSFPISDAAFPSIWLPAISFPNLFTLEISPRHALEFRSNDQLHNTLDFVRRHADTIRHICLGSPRSSRRDPRLEILELLPHIETLQLTISGLSERNGTVLDTIIDFVKKRIAHRGQGEIATGSMRRLLIQSASLDSLRAEGPENTRLYKLLQRCIRHGLVVEEIQLPGFMDDTNTL